MYNFIKVKIYKESKDGEKVFIGCIHFFNNEDMNNRLKKELLYLEKELLYLEKEYGNILYE